MSVITDAELRELSLAPKVTQGDEGRIEERSLTELINAQKQLNGNSAATLPPAGMRIARTRPPGTRGLG